jgi:hypothetical protein
MKIKALLLVLVFALFTGLWAGDLKTLVGSLSHIGDNPGTTGVALIRVFGAGCLVLAGAGLLSALLGFGAAASAFILGGLSLLIFWDINTVQEVLALAFVLAGMLVYFNCRQALSQRLRFSVWTIGAQLGILIVVMAVCVAAAFYEGSFKYIADGKRVVPAPVVSFFAGGVRGMVVSQLPENTDPKDLEELDKTVLIQTGKVFDDLARKYGRFIPLAVAIFTGFAWNTIVNIFVWLPMLLLRLVASTLIWAGLITLGRKQVEAEFLSLE